MKKFILNRAFCSSVQLSGSDFHYLARVRRLGPGDVFNAVFSDSTEAQLTVVSVSHDALLAECLPLPKAAVPSIPPIYLFQALPKGAKMDLIVRQAAEAGVTEIAPFISEHSAPEAGKEKTGRWKRIIREARQQSGSSIETTVRDTCCLDELLKYWEELNIPEKSGAGIVLHQDPLEPGTFHDYLSNTPGFVAVAVGPEGGFSPAEAGRFMAAGFRPLALGGTILRTETAALYGVAAIRTLLTESASWLLKKNLPRSRGEE